MQLHWFCKIIYPQFRLNVIDIANILFSAFHLVLHSSPAASNYLLAACHAIHLHLLLFLPCIPIISRANIVRNHVKNRNSCLFARWVLISQYSIVLLGLIEANADHLSLITLPIPT